ncbi:MAG TPA: hypothetical protein VIG24_01215, partial [Acidimicrobiia bacterium]
MFMRTPTSARSNRTSLRIAGSGVAAAALVGSSLALAPHASASVEECGDASVTYVAAGDYCEISFDDPALNGQAGNSWEVPTGVRLIDLLVVGGGGGGGGAAGGGGNTDSVPSAGGGGGGGGAVALLEAGLTVVSGQTVTAEIGEGGTGGDGGTWDHATNQSKSSAEPGNAGGDTRVTGASLGAPVIATGGGGGQPGVRETTSAAALNDTDLANPSMGGIGGVGRVSSSGGGGAGSSST